MSNLVISKARFVDNFLVPLGKFNLADNPAQVTFKDDTLIGITHAAEQNPLCCVTIKDAKGDDFGPVIFKHIGKIMAAMGSVEEPTLTLQMEDNHFLYEDNQIKFKSFFLDNRFFNPKTAQKMDKLGQFDYDVNFTLSQPMLTKVKKSRAIVVSKDTDKVYVSGTNKGIVMSRHDIMKKSIDTIAFTVATSFTGNDFPEIPLSMEIFDLIAEKKEPILVELCTRKNIIMFTSENDDYKLKYITTALRK